MSNYSRNSNYGGSCIFVNKEIAKYCKSRDDLVNLSKEGYAKISAIEIKMQKCERKRNSKFNNIVIISIYRPTSPSSNYFFDILEIILSKIASENKKVLCCGDFNIDFFIILMIKIIYYRLCN